MAHQEEEDGFHEFRQQSGSCRLQSLMGSSWICLFYSLLPLYNEVSNKLSYAPMVMFYIIIDKESVESRTEPSVIVIHHK